MKQILKILSYPFSVLFYLCFGLSLVVFHPLQWIGLNTFGYKGHKVMVDTLQWCLMRCLNILGTRFTFTIEGELPKNVPLIIISNHQSMWDIPPVIWKLRNHHPKFISKKELGKGIPSVSYNLRNGGSVLIDRKDPIQAMEQIVKIARYASQFNRSVVIYPEGTRSRDGYPKPWKKRGLDTLIKEMPDGYLLPMSISNSWKLQRYGMFPLPLGAHLKFIAHPVIKIANHTPEELISMTEKLVIDNISHD
ncbi:MAG: 1-acyl-sn-glycerol-3-phosphate acyltransferase [Planctomycetota bacterium]|uniref:lysophospholipid acyltransferase family protein n=1 Tax=Patiriisocius sp. Uisw_047 TaxID=3230969 RepID=UPI0039E93B0E